MHARIVARRMVFTLALAPACTGAPGSADDGGSSGAGTSSGTQGLDGPASSSGATTRATTDDTTGAPGDTTGAPAGSSSGLAETGTTGEATDASSSSTDSSTGELDEPRPPAPAGMTLYVTGDDEDADVRPAGPGLVLMGGGADVDEAFAWWGDLIAGGDVVVIRTSGADGYNGYLYGFGNADSVETMLVTPGFADDPYVSWTLRHAEAIWMAGGDQATYLAGWKDTGVEAAIHEAWARGAVVGGTSAGLAVLGQFAFAAYNDTVYSYEALEDPYNFYMTMEQGFLALPMLEGVIIDSHFFERDRMGRLVGFLARIHADGWATAAVGVGVDEATAIVVGPDGMGTVIGAGHAYVVRADHPPQTCLPGVDLEYDGLELHGVAPGGTIAFPGAFAATLALPLAAAGGVTIPADPYL